MIIVLLKFFNENGFVFFTNYSSEKGKSIEDIDQVVLEDIYKHFYQPSNILLTIAGRVDLEQMKKFFKAYDQQVK